MPENKKAHHLASTLLPQLENKLVSLTAKQYLSVLVVSSMLQPLDVRVYKSMEALLHAKWGHWIVYMTQSFTADEIKGIQQC